MAEIQLTLAPAERGLVGEMMVANDGDRPVTLTVTGTGPVLHERQIIRAEDANTPALRLYYTVLQIYLDPPSFGERYQDDLASRGYEPVLRTRGQDYMIGEFSGILRSADYTVANLETAVTDRFPSPYAGKRKYLHYGDVAKTPFYLAKYGVDLPICKEVYGVLYEGATAQDAYRGLTRRPPGSERESD